MEQAGEGVKTLLRRHLDHPSPWNTYRHKGLPPTPICNPGVESPKAALNPPESPYFYFVADGKGGHAFAETLDEHNSNVWACVSPAMHRNDCCDSHVQAIQSFRTILMYIEMTDKSSAFSHDFGITRRGLMLSAVITIRGR